MPEMGDRIALVTGAASGIGLAAAEVLAREGADVALISRPEDDLDGARNPSRPTVAGPSPIGADVADSDALRAAFERVEAELGPVDAVHNNAGISRSSRRLSTPPTNCFERSSASTSPGSFYVLREAARVMQPRRTGRHRQYRLGAGVHRSGRLRRLHGNQGRASSR